MIQQPATAGSGASAWAKMAAARTRRPASAGLIPCPSALVVLLGAISQHQVALGLLLILTFSLGLAMTLTALGIAVVYAGTLTSRLNLSGRVVRVLPSISALLIVGLGLMLTLRAVPKLM